MTCGCSAEKDSYGDRICGCDTCKVKGGCFIFELKVPKLQRKKECRTCGCSAEKDSYGDRICGCDSCKKDGCLATLDTDTIDTDTNDEDDVVYDCCGNNDIAIVDNVDKTTVVAESIRLDDNRVCETNISAKINDSTPNSVRVKVANPDLNKYNKCVCF
jgi:hypothetical protein